MMRFDQEIMPSYKCFTCGQRCASANELRTHVHRCCALEHVTARTHNPKPQESQP